MRLVEPDAIACRRVLRHGLAGLSRAQFLLAPPFAADAVGRAVSLNLAAIPGGEGLLPRQVQPVAVVARVGETLCRELLAHRRVESFVDATAVRDRRRATLFGRDDAMEPDPLRPGQRIGLLIVQRNCLVRRIFGRSVDPLSHGFSRSGCEVISDQRGSERGRKDSEQVFIRRRAVSKQKGARAGQQRGSEIVRPRPQCTPFQ